MTTEEATPLGGPRRQEIAEPYTKQDREAILFALRADPPMSSGPTALCVERYEATVVALVAEVATLEKSLLVRVADLAERRTEAMPVAWGLRAVDGRIVLIAIAEADIRCLVSGRGQVVPLYEHPPEER